MVVVGAHLLERLVRLEVVVVGGLIGVGGYPESGRTHERDTRESDRPTISASFLVKEVRLSAVWGQLAVSPGPASCQLDRLACGLRSVRARCHDAKATAAHVAHVTW